MLHDTSMGGLGECQGVSFEEFKWKQKRGGWLSGGLKKPGGSKDLGDAKSIFSEK